MRLNKSGCMKAVKMKVVTGMELVEVGGLLTRGSVLMERLTEQSSPQISGQDVTYNSDTSPAVIKFESFHSRSRGQNRMGTPKIVGWCLFGTFIILLAITIVKAIIKILKISNRKIGK